jgi:hypothetical protein
MYAKIDRYNGPNTSTKQPWRSHPRWCQEEARRSNLKKGNSSHALIPINSPPNAWIVDSGASHHMETTKEVYSSLDACKGPHIWMGDNSQVEVIDN